MERGGSAVAIGAPLLVLADDTNAWALDGICSYSPEAVEPALLLTTMSLISLAILSRRLADDADELVFNGFEAVEAEAVAVADKLPLVVACSPETLDNPEEIMTGF